MPHVHKGSLQKNRKFKGSTKSAKKTARLVQSSSKALRVAKTKPITKSLSQPKSKVRKAHKMHTMRKSADEVSMKRLSCARDSQPLINTLMQQLNKLSQDSLNSNRKLRWCFCCLAIQMPMLKQSQGQLMMHLTNRIS